jgi:hypothetical protein
MRTDNVRVHTHTTVHTLACALPRADDGYTRSRSIVDGLRCPDLHFRFWFPLSCALLAFARPAANTATSSQSRRTRPYAVGVPIHPHRLALRRHRQRHPGARQHTRSSARSRPILLPNNHTKLSRPIGGTGARDGGHNRRCVHRNTNRHPGGRSITERRRSVTQPRR